MAQSLLARADYEFGLDAELKEKQKAKYSPEREKEATEWVEAVTGEKFNGFWETLYDGVILCNLINKIKPGTIKQINKSKMAFKMMENISAYLAACKTLGVPETNVFMTVDLYEKQNLGAVVDNIHALGAASRKVAGFSGPYLGPKLADKNARNFSKEVLDKGKGMMTKVSEGSYAARDAIKGAHTPVLDKIVQLKKDPMLENAPAPLRPVNASDAKVNRCTKCGGNSGGGKFCAECGAPQQILPRLSCVEGLYN